MASILVAAELLPSQGPITAFVFLNTLQALEGLPVEEGMKKGSRLFGCQVYLPEDRYRESLVHGRILREDLEAELEEDLKSGGADVIAGLVTRKALRMAMLEFSLRFGPTEELQWFVAESGALDHLRDEMHDSLRQPFINETRQWAMRDLRMKTSESGIHRHDAVLQHNLFGDLLTRFGVASIERWTDATWEAFSLHALWRISRHGVHIRDDHPLPAPHPLRHRGWMQLATGEDTDRLVHDVLIRFCSAYADQGFARWPLPKRNEGLFRSFAALYGQPSGVPDAWMGGLSSEIQRIERAGLTPMESVLESLELLGVEEEEWPEFIPATLLALRGWAGLLWQMEVRADRVPVPAPSGTLLEFLAVRLILERVALVATARRHSIDTHPLSELRDRLQKMLAAPPQASIAQRAFLVFQLAQVLGWSAPRLTKLTKSEWHDLIFEIEAFSGHERRRMYHEAFERRFRVNSLDAFIVHAKRPSKRVESPRYQIATCIDTREEGFRRHLEEVAPEVETFAAAGFFGVPIYYRGSADAHFATLCPIVVMPKHWLTEEVSLTLEEEHRRRAQTRKAIGKASHQVHVRSRTIAGGALLTGAFGVLASIPLVARVLFPRLTSQLRRRLGKFVEPPPVTRLCLERTEDPPGPENGHVGFRVSEMAEMSERLLRDIGLTSGFARVVVFLGHGSYCLNNPHKSAYDCGACSGGAGGPNARALAAMLNDPRVRAILAEHDLAIPKETVFLGGMHNTCTDVVTFYDLDLLPNSHRADYEFIVRSLAEACERNAHERCRRFQSAPLNLSFPAAHRHVEGRSQDLAQTRPEFGNASNALCFVGRRATIRGLYLDRRSFDQAYDPKSDDAEFTILGRILGAVVPVCSGINLQYYFSYVDSPGFGAGTKLPHNVVSLLGVMNGPASDLRPGLPWQGVEIHEPMRLLLVIESTPEAIRKIMARNVAVDRILRNEWMQLALLNPDSKEMLLYRHDEFTPYTPITTELPQTESSTDWYRGWRDHLGFAQIRPATSTASHR